MQRVRVTFFVEPTDTEHPSGLDNANYEMLSQTVLMEIGGEDIDVSLVECDDKGKPITEGPF